MDDIQYIGDGKFVVTEEWLRDVFSQAVSMNEALEELYPDYALDYASCRGVAEAMIYDWRNNASKAD